MTLKIIAVRGSFVIAQRIIASVASTMQIPSARVHTARPMKSAANAMIVVLIVEISGTARDQSIPFDAWAAVAIANNSAQPNHDTALGRVVLLVMLLMYGTMSASNSRLAALPSNVCQSKFICGCAQMDLNHRPAA